MFSQKREKDEHVFGEEGSIMVKNHALVLVKG